MERLYQMARTRDNKKIYRAVIRGGHCLALYRTATGAQRHSLRVRERYLRLKGAGERLTRAANPDGLDEHEDERRG
jgi:hypothetical protein